MRLVWVDVLKGLLIALVVLGHIAGAAENLSTGLTSNVFHYVRRMIYLFHMPAFFVLAGWMWHRNADDNGNEDDLQCVVADERTEYVRRNDIEYHFENALECRAFLNGL